MITDAIYYHYLSALLGGNKAECVKIIANLLEKNEDVKEIYTKLFQKSMYRVGYLWEHNRASVANEHRATKITESLLSLVYPKILDIEKVDKKVIITCIDKEFHELGARMVSDYFELMGWNSIFLGANTPQNEILNIIKEEEPDLVGISNNFYINVARLLKLLEKIKEEFPKQKVIVGGQALNGNSDISLNKFKGVTFIHDLNELEEYIRKQS